VSTSVVIAWSGFIVAWAGFGLSLYQARATRLHNRRSVRPVLQFGTGFRQGSRAGLGLQNVGLGPAAIRSSSVILDGKVVGPFGKPSIDVVRAGLTGRRPSASTFADGAFLARDFSDYLLSLEDFDKVKDQEFATLIDQRLRIELVYDSLYGGEAFTVSWTGREPSSV
jgi:hypothetical protein